MNAMLLSLLFLAAPAAPAQDAPAVQVHWQAPDSFVKGQPYRVTISAEAGDQGGSVAEAWLTPQGFTIGGKALAEGADASRTVKLWPSEKIQVSLDLAPVLAVKGDFQLSWAGAPAEKKDVSAWGLVKDVDFMNAPAADLAKYHAVLETNEGTMVAEMWPDVAPNTVKSFLDLCETGFYDGILFHRVIPGFMIQGGDPLTKDPSAPPSRWGTGGGPRKLQAEFSDKKHVRGVLSMARLSGDQDSATSQFFICHAAAPNLDHQYSAFGKLLSGYDALDAIATTPRTQPGDRPLQPQRIEHAYVVAPLSAD